MTNVNFSNFYLSEEEIICLVGAKAAEGASRSLGLKKGIGDDAAVLDLRSDNYVVTTDLLVEGIHFDLGFMSPRDVGWRAMAANLSDLAAMGALPRWGFLSLGFKSPVKANLVEGLLDGLIELSNLHGLALAGGDTVRASQLLLNLCLIGAMEGIRPIFRVTQPGEIVCVTGSLGLSAGGLAWLQAEQDINNPLAAPLIRAYCRPTPRLAVGRVLASSGLVTAMMDISDGIASDLSRLALASKVGIIIRESSLPLSPLLFEIAQRLGADPLSWALFGGEDFELLFTCAPQALPLLSSLVIQTDPGLSIRIIGEVEIQPGLWLEKNDGNRYDIAFQGYDHFRL